MVARRPARRHGGQRGDSRHTLVLRVSLPVCACAIDWMASDDCGSCAYTTLGDGRLAAPSSVGRLGADEIRGEEPLLQSLPICPKQIELPAAAKLAEAYNHVSKPRSLVNLTHRLDDAQSRAPFL